MNAHTRLADRLEHQMLVTATRCRHVAYAGLGLGFCLGNAGWLLVARVAGWI